MFWSVWVLMESFLGECIHCIDYLVLWELCAVQKEIQGGLLLFERRPRELKRELHTDASFNPVLHVCGSKQILRIKAWKKLQAVSLCTRWDVEVSLSYSAGHVWFVRTDGEKDFYVLSFGNFAVRVGRCAYAGCRCSTSLGEMWLNTIHIYGLIDKCGSLARWELLTVEANKRKGFVLTASSISFFFCFLF